MTAAVNALHVFIIVPLLLWIYSQAQSLKGAPQERTVAGWMENLGRPKCEAPHTPHVILGS